MMSTLKTWLLFINANLCSVLIYLRTKLVRPMAKAKYQQRFKEAS